MALSVTEKEFSLIKKKNKRMYSSNKQFGEKKWDSFDFQKILRLLKWVQ